MVRELTCITCPMGCHLVVTLEEGKVVSVTGNTCPRGAVYAENECTHPMRTVTSTVRTVSGLLCAVETDNVIPKEKMFECMRLINGLRIETPVHIGDVLIPDVFGANVVATENID